MPVMLLQPPQTQHVVELISLGFIFGFWVNSLYRPAYDFFDSRQNIPDHR